MQTDKVFAWARPKLVHTFLSLSFQNVIFKILRDMSRSVTISRRNKSKLLRDYFRVKREQTDCGQTMQLSCLENKPHMVTGTKGARTDFFCQFLVVDTAQNLCLCRRPKNSKNHKNLSSWSLHLVLRPGPLTRSRETAQEWTNRTLISHEPLICSKMCITKTKSVQ